MASDQGEWQCGVVSAFSPPLGGAYVTLDYALYKAGHGWCVLATRDRAPELDTWPWGLVPACQGQSFTLTYTG